MIERIEDRREREENEAKKEERQRERFASRQSKTVLRMLRRLKELSGAPSALNPFIQVLQDTFEERLPLPASQKKKRVGTYCVMVPPELIYAAGAIPVKLCSGDFTAFSVGDEQTPRDACPLVKAVEGFVESHQMPLYEDCSLMVVPITCDCKKKIAEMLKEACPVLPLRVPALRGDDDIDAFTDQLYELLSRLEKLTGRKVTYDSLRKAMRMEGNIMYALSTFAKLRRSNPYLIRGSHALAALQACAYMPLHKQLSALRALNEELLERKKQGTLVSHRNLPKILLIGSPFIFPNFKVPLLIEEMGGIVVADETCQGERGRSDPAVPVDTSFDGMMRALANRSLRPCSCPTFADNSERIYRIKQLIKEGQISGVIYHVLRGCLVYDFEYRLIEEELGKMDIPIIRLETDYNEEDVEQLRIRIEAFIELLRLSQEPAKAPVIRRDWDEQECKEEEPSNPEEDAAMEEKKIRRRLPTVGAKKKT